MKKITCISLIILSFLLSSFRKESTSRLVFQPVSGKGLKNVELVTGSNGKRMYRLVDNSYRGMSRPMISDIVLSFNKPSNELRRDGTGKYSIGYSRYHFSSSEKAVGEGAARFINLEHRVEINTSRDLWLGSCGDLGSFTIEFRFKPLSLKNGSLLFSRTGYFSGKKKGIEILIKNSRVIVVLNRLFQAQNGKYIDIVLGEGKKIEKGRWYHFVLSFDRLSGKLSKYINGEENESVYVSENSKPFDGVMTPSFGIRDEVEKFRCTDSVNAVIGSNYTGYMDEFRILYSDISSLENNSEIFYNKYKESGMIERVPLSFEGTVTSPVYTFPSTGTKITLFSWNQVLEKNTFIWFEMRIYDMLFDDDNNNLKWYTVDNNQRGIYLAKNESGEYLRGKYYQWRAHLIASPDGKRSPYLDNIEINYILDNPPVTPVHLEVMEEGDGFIRIRWMKNRDLDILGYRIYYGTKPDRYDGVLSYLKQSRITNKMSVDNYVEIVIDNRIIDENKIKDNRNILTYPKLVNNVLYYFSVSAYDDYRPDTPFNHESNLSKQVSGRPYHGTDIK